MGLNLPQQVRSVRLVNKDGIIRRETFYKYLMVWCSMDYLGYTFSQVTSVFIMILAFIATAKIVSVQSF